MATKTNKQMNGFLFIRMQQADIDKCKTVAKTLGISLSAWVRMTLKRTVKEEQ